MHDPGPIPRMHIPQNEQNPERRQRIQTRPLHSRSQTEADPRSEDPGTRAEAGPEVESIPPFPSLPSLLVGEDGHRCGSRGPGGIRGRGGRLGEGIWILLGVGRCEAVDLRGALGPGGQALRHLLAVEEDEEEGEEDEGHEHDVEQARAGVDEVLAVDGEEAGGDAGEERRTEELPGDDAEEEDRQRADDRHGEAPAERIVGAEEVDAPPDEPFAQGRVDDVFGGGFDDAGVTGVEGVVGVLGPGAFIAEVEDRVAVLDVVGLVEDQAVREVEAEESQGRTDSGDDEQGRPHPQRCAGGPHAGVEGFAAHRSGAGTHLFAFPRQALAGDAPGGGRGVCGVCHRSPV